MKIRTSIYRFERYEMQSKFNILVIDVLAPSNLNRVAFDEMQPGQIFGTMPAGYDCWWNGQSHQRTSAVTDV